MRKKNSNITVTDQFCGAGGSSQGVRLAAKDLKLGSGLEVKLAMNHWKLAIETHNTNFPDTDHVCTDISACDPRRYNTTNILITSPECTVHSPAGGGQAKKKKHGNQLHMSGKLMSEIEEERSRATMWDVCRFAEYHRYELIIVENVVEARSKWVLFDEWLSCMRKLGYDFEIKYINSMHAHPTPQSRDRMYCVFWKKGNKKPDLNFNPVAPCVKCMKNVDAYQWWKPLVKREFGHGKYRQQYLYKCSDCHSIVEPYFYAAFNCIDWSNPGTRIGDRKKPLSKNTEARCKYGIDKYWDEPSFINVKFSSGIDFRVKPVSEDPLTTQPTDQAVGVLNPMIISSRYITGIGNRVKDGMNRPLPVQVTDGRESLFHAPIITSRPHGDDTMRVRSSEDVLPTQLKDDCHSVLRPPLIMDGGWSSSKRVDEAHIDAMSTQDTGQTKGMLMPQLIKNFSGPVSGKAVSVEGPAGSFTTADHHGILNPPLIDVQQRNTKPHLATTELHAQTTAPKSALLLPEQWNAFLSYYYSGSKMASNIGETMRTVTVQDRHALVQEPYRKPRFEDCYYRMLLPPEIQLGMAFDEDYIVLGDSKSKVKQLGNAVTPPVMKFLITRCVQSLM